MITPKNGLFCLALLIGLFTNGQKTASYSSYVNPFIGTAPMTDSAILGYRLPEGWRSWAGLVFPGASLPNAMVQLSPITEYGSGAGYEYEDNVIYGFTHTNKGHWNLCNIPLLPMPDTAGSTGKFFSHFSHAREKASPGYYQVYLEDYGINVGLTATLRCGYHRYAYSSNKGRRVLFDLAKANNKVSGWAIEQAGNAVKGYQQTGRERIYFYAVPTQKIARLEKVREGSADGYSYIQLEDGGDATVEIKLGLSFVSTENARQNLERETGSKSFETVLSEGGAVWEQVLSSIQVKGGTEKQKRMFYSCLYRSLLWPALRSDVNGEYTDVKGNVVKADFNYYTVPSLWDTYRNKDVLLGIISPHVTLDVIKSLQDMGDKTGFIPTFFHGDHAASSITGAWLRGIDDFDVKDVYRLLLRNATVEGGTRPFISEYMQKGYISDPDIAAPHVESKGKAGVSKTLEYSYDDYSLAQMAKKLGDSANYRMLLARSKNYKNVFDRSTRFMRGRLENGEWIQHFNPQYPYYEYMYREANAWQVSFYAPHDMKGLIALYGGAKNFEAKLDSLFTLPWNPHYIARNVETMVGQYCQGNQPDHEAAFSYYFIGKPEKSQRQLDYIMNNLYGIGREGLELSGMDDAGEMSAWYVFNALGLYPFSATDPEYIVTVPVFDEVRWAPQRPKGEGLMHEPPMLIIKKTGSSRELKGILVNGKKNKGYFVPHELFKKGGIITVQTK
ncbi:MAG: GH92 family glycosyl hydrolase [Bacteroidetes bacterium]|nr:GH92 family glycosyl hydrolase [Bacteroidota bacterium]